MVSKDDQERLIETISENIAKKAFASKQELGSNKFNGWELEQDASDKLYEAGDENKSEVLIDFIKEAYGELKKSGEGLHNTHCWRAHFILEAVLKAEGLL